VDYLAGGDAFYFLGHDIGGSGKSGQLIGLKAVMTEGKMMIRIERMT
jgi:hypothetical protein